MLLLRTRKKFLATTNTQITAFLKKIFLEAVSKSVYKISQEIWQSWYGKVSLMNALLYKNDLILLRPRCFQ